MTNILYTYNGQLYANITNRCDCNCRFCIRSHKDNVGEAENLWFQEEPTMDEIKKAIDEFDFTGYDELVFCGYGEPTCALNHLLESAAYLKKKHPIQIRLNTNGLGNLYHKRNIVPELAKVVDRVSISLNAPTEEKYQEVSRPQFEHAFEGLLEFAKLSKEAFSDTQLSVVDVLPIEDIEASQKLADELGIYLRIRPYE